MRLFLQVETKRQDGFEPKSRLKKMHNLVAGLHDHAIRNTSPFVVEPDKFFTPTPLNELHHRKWLSAVTAQLINPDQLSLHG